MGGVFYTTAAARAVARRPAVSWNDMSPLRASRNARGRCIDILDNGRRPHIALEGIPILLVLTAAAPLAWIGGGFAAAALPLALLAVAFAIFHDPPHVAPAAPRGIVSPVDGKVVHTGLADPATGGCGALSIVIRVNTFGTYTARSPVEGKVMDLHGEERTVLSGGDDAGLWLRTDEGMDVVLLFRRSRFGLAPRSLLRYGERVGQGHPCAYLRLARLAEVRVPAGSALLVEPGQRVAGGLDPVARFPSAE